MYTMKKLKDNWYMIRFVFKFAPTMFILKILTMFTSLAVNIGFNIFFLKKVVDSMPYGGNFKGNAQKRLARDPP